MYEAYGRRDYSKTAYKRRGALYSGYTRARGCWGLFDAIRKEEAKGNIKYIQVKHEQAATAIADGYYRMTGKPLATFASIGPGTLNTAIGLATAYVDSTAFCSYAAIPIQT